MEELSFLQKKKPPVGMKAKNNCNMKSTYICRYDIRLISRPIHAPSHELEDKDTNRPPTKVLNKRILVELLGIREESVILYLRVMNQVAYFSLLFYTETCLLHLGVRCTVVFDA